MKDDRGSEGWSCPWLVVVSIIVPNTSSEKRKYLPIMFMPESTVVSMPDLAIPNGDFYDFGILASSVHTAWIKTVCGRNEMRFFFL